MRSITRQRLALCGRLSTTTLAPRGEQDAFLDWLSAKRFVVGGKVSSRVELRASRAALKRQIAAADELYDLVGASVPGARVMRAMDLDPDAGALLEPDDLTERWVEWCATRVHFAPPSDAAPSAE